MLHPAQSGNPNWEARLARMLVRGTGKNRSRAAMIGVIAALWLILTFTGSYLASRELSVPGKVANALYGALTFLAPRDAYSGIGHSAPLPALLWWGRFFGVALSMLTILWAALYRFRWRIAGLLIRARAEGHMIVFSANGFADGLAREAGDRGACVVLIEKEVPNERVTELSHAGVIVIPEGTSLAQALRECRITSAASVICWTESDSVSLSAALVARDAINDREAEVLVRLDSPEMQRSLRSAPELLQTPAGRLRPISPTVSAVRSAFSDAGLVRQAVERQQERVHVCLHGDTPALGMIASFVLSHNWSVYLGSPTVTWITGPHNDAWRHWAQRNYCFLQYADVAFGGEDTPRIVNLEGIATAGPKDFTAHVVDFGDDDRTIAAAMDLAALLAQKYATPPLVKAVLRDAHAIGELLRASRILAFSDPVLIGANLSFGTLADYVHKAAEAHDRHLFSRGTTSTSPATAWHALDETYVQANHAASDHGSIKDFDADHAVGLGRVDDALMEEVARTEHSRWMVERLLDGWAPARPRNNDRRLHDKLVPWSELPQSDRDREVGAIRLELERRGRLALAPAREAVAVRKIGVAGRA